jgi:hypothetical protein
MSTGETKIPLPIVLFFSGIIPYALMTILGYFELLNLHGGLGTLFLMIITFTAPPICFVIGFRQSFKFKGRHQRIGLTLNGLGLAVVLLWGFGGFNWLMN